MRETAREREEKETERERAGDGEPETETDLTFKSRFMRPKKSSTLSGLALIASAEENSSRVVPTRRTMHGRIYLKWVYKVVVVYIYILFCFWSVGVWGLVYGEGGS